MDPNALSRFLTAAFSAVGREYIWGGTNLSRGVDCSGLIYSSLLYAGYRPPRVAADLHRWTQQINQQQARPGDLVFWDASSRPGIDHTGIYLGDGKVLEASSGQDKVLVRQLWGRPMFGRITAGGGAPNTSIVMGPNKDAAAYARAIAGGGGGGAVPPTAGPPDKTGEGSTDPYLRAKSMILATPMQDPEHQASSLYTNPLAQADKPTSVRGNLRSRLNRATAVNGKRGDRGSRAEDR